MAHHCEAALITCEDFRLHQRKNGNNCIADFIKSLRVDCDLITRAGGVQDLIRPKQVGFDKSILRDEEVSTKLHHANTIYLVNHEDCGAYNGMNFSSRNEEVAQHKKDLKVACDILNKQFPGTEIKLYFAELKTGTNDVFIIQEIN